MIACFMGFTIGEQKLHALKDVSLTVEAGDVRFGKKHAVVYFKRA